MKKPLLWLLLACSPLCANEDQFRERFADPATRTAALSELIPGTQSAFFHTALNHQLAGREAEFRQTLADWKAAHERKDNPIPLNGFDALENRELLLTYEKNPLITLTELVRRLDLHFDDARPDAAAAAESLPTRLDPALVSPEAFEKLVAQSTSGAPYTRYFGDRLLRELDQVETFDDAKVRYFLGKIDRADLPGVVPLVDRALGLDRTLSFTENRLLENLTSRQLDALRELHPDLTAKLSFDVAYLTKLRPGAETDFARNPQALAAHLQRCRDFAITLPPALNTLKAHVLFHHLRLQMEQGNFPKADFLAFLALPRASHPLLRVPVRADPTAIQLGEDFADATGCPPVGNDLPLIRAYLAHFLGQTDSAAEFAPFVPEKMLANLHARARLLAGADPAKWAAALDPAEFKSLQQEARIDFAPGAPALLDADAAVSLAVDLKNTPDLLVRIYELDLPTQLAENGSEPDVDIDLDGLVPHHERHVSYAQAPIVQHRETLALPELSGPGAWLVEFVSGQVSARALIRKGRLVVFPARNATGQTVRVFDEKGTAVPTASIQLGRETIAADASGTIVIPDAPNHPLTEGIVRAGKLAAPIFLATREDEIALETSFFLDREQLLADQEAQLHFRVRLTNHGLEIPLDRIKDPALVLKAELLGGVTTERVVAEDLKLTPVMEIPFQVPADLRKLTLTLRGTVDPATGADPLKLSEEAIYNVNGDLAEARIATAFFSPVVGGHRLEVRGRNGEPLASRAITLECRRVGYDGEISVETRTDPNGRIDLGPLEDLRVVAKGTDISPVSFKPEPRSVDVPTAYHVVAGTEIRMPLQIAVAAPDHVQISLLETVKGAPIRDHFDKLSVDAGRLIIHGLPPGDYRLTQDRKTTDILVSAGTAKADLLISPTRILPQLAPHTPDVAKAAIEGTEVKIQLRGHGPATRISVIGKRYAFDWPTGQGLEPFAPTVPDTQIPGFVGNGFLTDRRLSDEARYIYDRRAATTFPGVMLPRPGILLNRWTGEDLDQGVLPAIGGDDGRVRSAPGARGSGRGFGTGSLHGEFVGNTSPVCDFLQYPAVVRFDLTPAADGSLALPLAQFEGCQFLEIVATDAFANEKIVLPLAANETPVRDRRIARPLDPQAHFLANRSAAVLQKGAEATIENLLDADWRAFTTLTEAHQFLYGMTGDDRLREFVFLTEWPTFPEAKKLELLSQHACHEFHLFLSRKDPEFFAKFVKPLLAGKPEPQFMDDYLLGRDLTKHLRPYAWQRLNAAEKALLAQALPAARERISRELKLRWDLEAPAPDVETTLFAQTLRGSDLAIQDSLGLARNKMIPEGDIVFSDERTAANGPTAGVSFITEKLRSIVIPSIDFQDTTVEEAIDFLRLRATELDATELDPSKKGMNFVIRRPRSAAGAGSLPAGSDPGALRIKELRLRNVPLAVALKYICDQTKLRYKVDDYAITLVPQTEAGEDIFTRTFRVPPDFQAMLDNSETGSDASDPFAAPSAKTGGSLTARKPISELLKEAGINMPEGSSATLSSNGVLLFTGSAGEMDKVQALTMNIAQSPGNADLGPPQTPGFRNGQDFISPMDGTTEPFAPLPGGGESILTRSYRVPRDFYSRIKKDQSPRIAISEPLKEAGIYYPEGASSVLSADGVLTVMNTPTELEKIENLIRSVTNAEPVQITNGLRSGDQAISRNNIDAILNNPNRGAADPFAAPAEGGAALMPRKPLAPHIFPNQTKLWREANYYRNTAPTGETLIPLNRFWLELAAWDGKGPFLSPHFNACHTNANEALMCLALLDLPFKAERPEVTVDGSTLRVKAREPMLLFYKDTRRTEKVAAESPLLVRQTFSPLAEPFRTVDGRQVENPITGDFRPGVAYSASLIVTNPTGIGRRIDLLAQIPAGSIPLKGNPATRSSTHELEPYGVVKEELDFYFPAVGEFAVYPLHVSENDTVLAHTEPRTLRVSNDPAAPDAAAWDVLASEGSNAEVLQRLATENLRTIDLAAIRWRLKDRAFFLSVTALLHERLHFSPEVAAYGFFHNDVASIRDYLENSQVVRQLGDWLDSPLLEVRPRTHGEWESLEFDPLVNARAHPFGDNPRLTHAAALEHYRAFLDQLAWKPALDADDELTLTYFLFLQDRIGEALARFDKIDPAKLPGRTIYDYLHTVVLFHRERPAEAKAIAAQNQPALPPGLWRDRFQAVLDQADELVALDQPAGADKPAQEKPAPQLDLALGGGGKLIVRHRSLEKATLRLFSVDLEVLFSNNPFLQGEGGSGGQPAILPNATLEVALAADATETMVELPPALQQGNVLVAADSGSKKLLKVLDSRAIELRHTPESRTVQTLDAATGKPLAKTYVKVYAEMASGEIVFHKDGYTDLRGKFDYLSSTATDPARIKRLAVLVSHPEKGARTAIYDR